MANHPYRTLAAVFALWKLWLLAIALVASYVGPAYDTSGSLLEAHPSRAARLTSWDAIYFVQVARRGYLFEQEWAFGGGFPVLVAFLSRVLGSLGLPVSTSVVAIVIAHSAHLLSVLALYRLGLLVWSGSTSTAFVAAALHVLSPAGLFLSAPYSESSFSLFSFAGHLAFAAGARKDELSWSGDLCRVLAGLLYGLACTFRSNGLLNGVLFAWEALATATRLIQQPGWRRLRRLVVVGLGGLFVAAGSIGPQAVAYRQFCSGPSGIPGEEARPWCTKTVPSIYSFVQEHYWNTGLFRYWTLSNVPLFLLAAPMLSVLTWSTLDMWCETAFPETKKEVEKMDTTNTTNTTETKTQSPLVPLVRCLAVAQLILVGLTFTSYHVQIITRLSSGYPVWYWWLARNLAGGPRANMAGRIVGFMVLYASIQGVLFSSFLPPA